MKVSVFICFLRKKPYFSMFYALFIVNYTLSLHLILSIEIHYTFKTLNNAFAP